MYLNLDLKHHGISIKRIAIYLGFDVSTIRKLIYKNENNEYYGNFGIQNGKKVTKRLSMTIYNLGWFHYNWSLSQIS